MTALSYVVYDDGLLLLDGFLMESANSCGYSLLTSKLWERITTFRFLQTQTQ
jgi:hypothetical protein